MIEITALGKSFGKVQAVDGVSFRAGDGQITGLLGPNGAGKTTTLRMLYGLMAPDSGDVQVDGIRVDQDAIAARRRLGVLPDARGLYRRLTARENIVYFARLQGLDGTQAQASAQRWLDRLGMAALADRRVEGFSQGERVKTALARALVHDPRNVVLDEPGNGLDVMAMRNLRDSLRELRAEGRCVLLSTHLMQEAAALCDHIVVLAHGRVAAQGSPQELRERADGAELEDAFVGIIESATAGAVTQPAPGRQP